MNTKESKVLATIGLIILFVGISRGIYAMTVGNYFANNLLGGLILLIFALVAFYYIGKGVRHLWIKALLLLILQGCNYAKSNQQVVISTDCGVNWSKINAGESVPKGVGNYCFMKVVIPNHPMQGDSRFVSNLKDHVRASVHIDYDYSITEPLAFIKQAKFLGKANTNADDETAVGSGFESAENIVIEKRIRDVGKQIFLTEDIVDLDQAEVEIRLQTEANKVLEPLGVRLNFITLTFDLDEQTRQAIDVSTAMKIYTSKGLTDVGKQVMIQRAGAARIVVENKAPAPATPAAD